MNKNYEPYEDKYMDYLYEDACKNVNNIIDTINKNEVQYNKFYERLKDITWRAYELNDQRTVVFTHNYDDKYYSSLKSCIDDALCGATTAYIPDFKFYTDFNFDFQRMTPVCESKFGETTVTFYAIPVIY